MSTENLPGETGLTPIRIALIYLLVGGAWILLSDQVVATLPIDNATETYLQTAKGWLFVGFSSVLVYALVARGRRNLQTANRQLRSALQQSSVLHRVLRHNLRNSCNVIAVRSAELADGVEGRSQAADAIEQRVEDLLTLTEKAKHLRQVTLGEQERADVEVMAVIEREVDAVAERHPTATVEVDGPPEVYVRAYPKLEVVVGELVENALEHGSTHPRESASGDTTRGQTIEVTVRHADGTVAIEVADEGPGFPKMERTILERDVEDPLSHSRGVGLWVVRTIVTASGGDLEVVDSEPSGTTVRVLLPASTRPAHRQTV